MDVKTSGAKQTIEEDHGRSITDAIASLERTVTEQFQLLIKAI